ncbi:MAG: hypothetical protein EBX02_08035 [Betaproteobacteria bacterium]|nr:hypothetical protein [Betaproteobacteria bacterium]
MSFEMLDDEPQPGKLEPTAQQDAAGAALAESSNVTIANPVNNPVKQIIDANQIKELALWQDWALRHPEKAASFKSLHLSEEITAPIRERLASARTDLEIVKAFTVGTAQSDILVLANAINRAAEKL